MRPLRRGRLEWPENVFDRNLQHERTALAWERTAFSGLAVGAITTRVGTSVHVMITLLGVVQVCLSAGLLMWTGRHYERRNGRLQAGESSAHPASVRLVGLATTLATGLTLFFAALLVAEVWPSR